jgi:hypothetical protein
VWRIADFWRKQQFATHRLARSHFRQAEQHDDDPHATFITSICVIFYRIVHREIAGAHNVVAYVPLYASGVPLVRSIFWNVATVGIILVLLGLM